ncbi:peptide chain release factor 3 [Sandaracinobacteroides saxicola]|uniref:Peptide chain release factor 3 n=1 Tax=Sandaracinobacteroides saxicola TaxID=2759707 RepID=A0A7G5IG05_9SPHN|nr:peptide chain release factor 3 [Sandaracinobacteroides saxicola]QMW22297.1 peptide chain release factor 3 [Sandaracinobacteroides saxicola]
MAATNERRTFAIISHPDAGKTTLTEKLLLAGGAIHIAGEVRARGDRRRAASDWMKIEQQRGISVTSSVMTFERDDITFNLLDTPGHEDFSEDTYRTLTAVDSAVMVIDAAKGIEAQTRKLFEVCRLRDVPIITFVNKVDREGRDAFALMDEVADTLALDVTPLTWPVGMGGTLKGVWDFASHSLLLPGGGVRRFAGLADPALDAAIGADEAAAFREEAALALGGYGALDAESYRAGNQTPVLFGSALRDLTVEQLLAALALLAPGPRAQPALPAAVMPDEPEVAGFVFKVQANMNPQHRDRIAFMRLCSGRFRRGMKLKQVSTGKMIAVHSPILFMARDRNLAEEAFPGDIIGIPNHGVLRVGDTLTEGRMLNFTGIPNFAPEILRRVRLLDPTRSKQLRGALTDMAEEGVTQLFRPMIGSAWIVGVVGALQLDVLIARLEAEYNVAAEFEPSPFETARWISADDPAVLKAFVEANRSACAEDRDGAPVYLARDGWELKYTADRNPGLRFSATRERA